MSAREQVEHHASFQPGLSPWLHMTYQAVCDCGWHGDWWPGMGAARNQAEEHVTEAVDGDSGQRAYLEQETRA